MRLMRRERGASAVLVAILLVPLVGVTALAIDVGRLYVERAQLQNGADAAALAVAAHCLKGVCPLETDLTIATAAARDNANDDHAAVAVQDIDLANKTVRIQVTTVNADGSTSISSQFAAAAGVEDSATTVSAEATAKWAGSDTTLPLALTVCEFESVAAGTGASKWIRYDTGKNCQKDPSEPAANGGFGWLAVNASPLECAATVGSDGFVGSRPGNGNLPSDMIDPPEQICDDTFSADLPGQTVYIPLADNSNGLSGSNLEWHIEKYGKFTLLGWNFSGGRTTRLPDLWEPAAFDSDGTNCLSSCNGVHVRFEGFIALGELPGGSVAEAVTLID